jgi:LysR family transcriptional regulator for metE and metH
MSYANAMDLEIRHLKLVHAIAIEGGMTKAANRLHLTQSALSHQLKEIEERLNAPLYLRLKRKLVLTEAGQKLLQSAEKVLEELSQTEHNIRRLASGQTGSLRISTQCNTCYHWLPSMLTLFHKTFPDVDVEIVVEATHQPLEALLDGKLDLAIAYTKLPDKTLSYFPLFKDELIAVVSPQHPLAEKPYLTPQDFAEYPMIVYSVPIEENLVFQKFLNPAGVVPAKIYKVMLTEAILEMIKAGIGIGVLAKWAVLPNLMAGSLRGIRLMKKGIFRDWHAVTLKEPTPPRYLKEFISLLAHQALPTGKKISVIK